MQNCCRSLKYLLFLSTEIISFALLISTCGANKQTNCEIITVIVYFRTMLESNSMT